MPRPRLTALMTPRELAERLGWPTEKYAVRRLVRRIKARERVLGEQIFMRMPGGRLMTSDALLLHHMPEIVRTRDEVTEKVRQNLSSIEEKLAILDVRDKAIAARVRELADRVRKLEG